jgi:two-component system sensor histidine kinase KdpD
VTLFLVVCLYTRVIHVNPTTVALTFLVSVLIVSALGLRYALFTAFLAAAAYNYCFFTSHQHLHHR